MADDIGSIEREERAKLDQSRSSPELTSSHDGSSGPTADSAATSGNRLHADFNGDGYADLVVGVPFESVDGEIISGAVNVLYGTKDGLTEDDDQFWHQDRSGVKGSAAADDRFSEALAVGDFDGDGYDDLAIGVPGEELNSEKGAGAVNVIYGSDEGLRSKGDQLWHQGITEVRGEPEAKDGFGTALASGDFDGDGYHDLAIGVPFEDLGGETDAGMVHVLYGSEDGLSAEDKQAFNQDLLPDEESESFDGFAEALAAGDFDGDGYDDLAVGVGGEDFDWLENPGAVDVLYGSKSAGLRASSAQRWDQDTPGVEGLAESEDRFGQVLDVGDFDGDGYDDLAIGIPREDYGSTEDTGAVNVLYGTDEGLEAEGSQFYLQATEDVHALSDPLDRFGWALATGDFNADGRDDLAIGVPFENLTEINNGGLVNVLYGSADEGLTGEGDQLWFQDIHGIKGVSEKDDLFGFALTAGDYDGDGAADLAIGVASEDLGSLLDDAGAVNVIYGDDDDGLDSPGDQLWHQDVDGVDELAESGDGFGYSLR